MSVLLDRAVAMLDQLEREHLRTDLEDLIERVRLAGVALSDAADHLEHCAPADDEPCGDCPAARDVLGAERSGSGADSLRNLLGDLCDAVATLLVEVPA